VRVKIIPIKYEGYTFKSKLEARWAVFFDSLGERFEYEPESFKFKRKKFTPTFFLPSLQCWGKVIRKGTYDFLAYDQKEQDLVMNFVSSVGPLLYLVGMPQPHPSGLVFCLDTNESGGGFYHGIFNFRWCKKCKKTVPEIVDGNVGGSRTLHKADWSPGLRTATLIIASTTVKTLSIARS